MAHFEARAPYGRRDQLPSEILAPTSTIPNVIPANGVPTGKPLGTSIVAAGSLMTPDTAMQAAPTTPATSPKTTPANTATAAAAHASATAQPSSSGPSPGKIVAIVVPIIAVVLLIPILFLLFRSHQYKREQRRREQQRSSGTSGATCTTVSSGTLHGAMHERKSSIAKTPSPQMSTVHKFIAPREAPLPPPEARSPPTRNSMGLFDFNLGELANPMSPMASSPALTHSPDMSHPTTRTGSVDQGRSPAQVSVAQAVPFRRSQPSVISNRRPGRQSTGHVSQSSQPSILLDPPPPYMPTSHPSHPAAPALMPLSSSPYVQPHTAMGSHPTSQQQQFYQPPQGLQGPPTGFMPYSFTPQAQQPQFAPLNRIGLHTRNGSRTNLARSPSSDALNAFSRPSRENLRPSTSPSSPANGQGSFAPGAAAVGHSGSFDSATAGELTVPVRAASPGVLPQIPRDSLHWGNISANFLTHPAATAPPAPAIPGASNAAFAAVRNILPQPSAHTTFLSTASSSIIPSHPPSSVIDPGHLTLTSEYSRPSAYYSDVSSLSEEDMARIGQAVPLRSSTLSGTATTAATSRTYDTAFDRHE